MFIREKRVECGNDYMEIDIIPRTSNQEKHVKGVRQKKKRVSRPAQQNLNDKNAKRYFVQLGNGNFSDNDIYLTLTYKNERLPKNEEEAEKLVKNYLRRIAYKRKKEGLEELKYVLVTEYSKDKDGAYLTRIHHHIIMNHGVGRDDLEKMWTKQGKGRKRIVLGFANTKSIQTNENGIEGLCRYLVKDPQGRKRWSSSINLKRPTRRDNDYRYSKRKVEKLATSNDYGQEYFEKMYPNHHISDVRPVYYELTGWHIYLKMWRKKKTRDV